ncbi:MAG: class I adenylate-forming enzyme family protein [Dermatophilaceae bacterium]
MRTHEAHVAFPSGAVGAMLRSSARRHAHHPAFLVGRHSVTFAELDAMADRVARRVVADATPGPVVLPLAVAVTTAAVYYGVLRAGRVVVPVNPLLPVPALTRVCRETSASWLVADPDYLARLGGSGLPTPTQLVAMEALLDPEPRQGDSHDAVDEPDRPDHGPAQILFTSGTTGPSKAVELSHRAVKANAWQMSTAHEITHASRVLCHLPMLNPMHTNAAVFQGATQVLCPSQEIADTAAVVARHRVTHFYSQPVRLDRIARDPELAGLDLSSVRYIAAGSRAIAADVVRTLADRYGAYVFQGYGQTESCYLSHSDRPRAPKAGSVGYGLAGTETRIVGLDSGTVLPSGTLGELQIRGPQLMTRYLNRPDLQPFTPEGWFRSGDVAHLDEAGRVSIFDRLVDVARRSGQLVSPSQLERLAEQDPDVREAGAVLCGPQDDAGLHLFVVVQPPAPNGSHASGNGHDRHHDDVAGQIRMRLNERLPPEHHVCDLVVVSELPRLSINGKVDRLALRQRVAASSFACPQHDLVRTPR